jgi:DNA helicase-2/ATP-dependent DNA helicase PcrA
MAFALSPAQRQAVEHGDGPLLVIAGPGSGKTRVITERIVHLVARRAVPPGSILALTFTDKAAEEMKRRVGAALPTLQEEPHIATFHAFCYHLLRQRHFDRQLLDKVDTWIFLRLRIGELGLDRYQKLSEPGAFLHDLNEFFSRCQDELVDPEDFEAYVGRLEEDVLKRSAAALDLEKDEIARQKELARVFRRSRELIEAAGYSSFGSLISETLRLWQREPDVLEGLRERYRYLLVDEFQDTNFAQIELLQRLAAPRFNLTAVGDDDQAIYRFRGASHGAFKLFDQAFPGHPTVYLDRNYRSVKRILRVAEAVIARNDRYQAKPPLVAHRAEGERVVLAESPDSASEAAWVAAEVDRLAKQGIRYGDMAVLYRSHRHRDPVVEEFRRRGIPFHIRGLSVLSSAILRDLVAYLRVIHSPHHNISLTRVLLAPRWRFGEELARDLRLEASRARSSLYTILQRREPAALAGRLRQTGWEQLDRLLRELGAAAPRLPVPALLDRLLERLGVTFLATDPDHAAVAAFRKFLEEWEAKNASGTLAPRPGAATGPPASRLGQFLEYFRYFVEAGGMLEVPPHEESAEAVQMMTVHAAKGLEFSVVWILSVAPQRFPHREQRPVIAFPDALRKSSPPPANIHLQEERRLFYVAMTRARDRLYVSAVSGARGKASVFVGDLLRNPVVATRDIERLAVPAVAPCASRPDEPARPAPAPARHGGAGRGRQPFLFDQAGASDSPFHPDLAAWLARGVAPAGPAGNGRLILSATAIETYRECPLKFRFSHAMRIPTAPHASLTFGSALHQAVRAYFELRRRGLPSFEEIEQFYLGIWKGGGFEDAYQEEAYRRAGLEQLRKFVERHNCQPVDAQSMVFERAFTLDLGEDLILQGRIDQIVPLAPPASFAGDSPAVELVDYKTGRPRSPRDADQSLQLSVYALAARRQLKLNPARLTFYNLATNEAVSTVRRPEELDQAVQEIREVARKIEQGRFDPTPGFVCRYCEYVPICPAHER